MTPLGPFTAPKHCSVAGKVVVLSGLVATLKQKPEVIRKACSNSGVCMAKHGMLEQIPECLLHFLEPPSPDAK